MEIWIMMWMLQWDADSGKTAYQPRSQEIEGPRANCEKRARELRIYYLGKKLKFGNVYCMKKEDDER